MPPIPKLNLSLPPADPGAGGVPPPAAGSQTPSGMPAGMPKLGLGKLSLGPSGPGGDGAASSGGGGGGCCGGGAQTPSGMPKLNLGGQTPSGMPTGMPKLGLGKLNLGPSGPGGDGAASSGGGGGGGGGCCGTPGVAPLASPAATLASPRGGGDKLICKGCTSLVWKTAVVCPTCGTAVPQEGQGGDGAPMTPRARAAAALVDAREKDKLVVTSTPRDMQMRRDSSMEREENEACVLCGLFIDLDDDYCPLDERRPEDGPKVRSPRPPPCPGSRPAPLSSRTRIWARPSRPACPSPPRSRRRCARPPARRAGTGARALLGRLRGGPDGAVRVVLQGGRRRRRPRGDDAARRLQARPRPRGRPYVDVRAARRGACRILHACMRDAMPRHPPPPLRPFGHAQRNASTPTPLDPLDLADPSPTLHLCVCLPPTHSRVSLSCPAQWGRGHVNTGSMPMKGGAAGDLQVLLPLPGLTSVGCFCPKKTPPPSSERRVTRLAVFFLSAGRRQARAPPGLRRQVQRGQGVALPVVQEGGASRRRARGSRRRAQGGCTPSPPCSLGPPPSCTRVCLLTPFPTFVHKGHCYEMQTKADEEKRLADQQVLIPPSPRPPWVMCPQHLMGDVPQHLLG